MDTGAMSATSILSTTVCWARTAERLDGRLMAMTLAIEECMASGAWSALSIDSSVSE